MSTRHLDSHNASALLGVLIVVAILSTIAAGSLYYASNKRATVGQAGTWQEVLNVAESGAHAAIAAVQSGSVSGTTYRSLLLTSPDPQLLYGYAVANYAIGASTDSKAHSIIKIRSVGIKRIAGGKSLSMDSEDVVLRNLSLSGSIRTAIRTVEVSLKNNTTTDSAIASDGAVNMNNHNIQVDGFDSTDPNRSVGAISYANPAYPADPTAPQFLYRNGQPPATYGQFDVAPYNTYLADVTSNSPIINAGDAHIYGNVESNGGIATNTNNVSGEIRSDYYNPLDPYYIPSWTTTAPGISTGKKTTSSTINASTTISGDLKGSAQFKVTTVDLKGTDILTFDFGMTGINTNTSKNYVDLYVSGDFKISGGAMVRIREGVFVTIYVAGNVDITGGGFVNTDSSGVQIASPSASSLTMLGVIPLPPATASTPTWNMKGNSSYYGTFYAPNANVEIGGGGNAASQFTGVIAGKTVTMNGNVQIRYDESLRGNGLPLGFAPYRWVEDTGPNRSNVASFLP